MNVALVILHADPARGGAERYTLDLAGALTRRGHTVSLLASSFAEVPAGVTPAPVPLTARGKRARYQQFLGAVDRHLGTNSYDVVHAMLPVRRCDVYHPHAGLAVDAVAAGHQKYPPGPRRLFAALANRVNSKRHAFADVERALLTSSRPPVVLCLSDYVKQTVRRHYPSLPETRLATLFNAVDLARFDPARDPGAGQSLRRTLNIPPDQIIALMIAQDFARKGLREAILALRELASQKLTLLVVGRGNPGPYQRLARQARVSNHVLFAGPTVDPYPFYRAADLFVLPTRHDPCSLVVLESLAMGVPVISTRFNGACEIMTDGVHGRVLPDPLDGRALAYAIRHLTDESTRRAASDACLTLRPALSYETHLDRLEAIYLAAAKSGKDGR